MQIRLAIATTVAAVTLRSAAAGTIPIGYYPMPPHAAVGVSDSGSVLTDFGQLWTVTGGFQSVRSGGQRIAAQGDVIVTQNSNTSWLYRVSTGATQQIPSPPGGFNTFVTSVSADGSVCAGYDMTTDRPWRWTAATGSVTIAMNETARATDISRDGQRVIGWVGAGPFIFTQGVGVQTPAGMAGQTITSFERFSGDGSTILGGAYHFVGGRVGNAFKWTAAGGYQSLGSIGTLPNVNDQNYVALASNMDATLVGGSQGGRRAWIWDSAHGMRDLRSVLVNDFHFDLTNWTLERVLDISADGTYIVGDGGYTSNGVTEFRGWVAIIPEPGVLAVLVAGLATFGRRRQRAHTEGSDVRSLGAR